MTSTILSSIVGFSRMGPQRELKKLIEAFWKSAGAINSAESQTSIENLEKEVSRLQILRWKDLKDTGLDIIPSGEYSLYDQVLDTAFMFNAIPERYRSLETNASVRTYFAMARGHQEKTESHSIDVAALPMKKWFDTNCMFFQI